MPKTKIENHASKATSNIGWLAITHIIVNSFRFKIAQYADELLNDPSILQIQNYPAVQAEQIRNKIISYLKEFYQPIKEHGIPEDFGHRQNKAAIFGVDAILQTYLVDMYNAVASAKNLAKVNLSSRNIYSNVGEIEREISGISLQNLPTAKHAFFIGQMRHLITHKNGEVDETFLINCGIDMNTLTLAQGKSPLWDTTIWPTEKEFLSKFQPPTSGQHFQLSLAIENVVLPYLHRASEFVTEVFSEFKNII